MVRYLSTPWFDRLRAHAEGIPAPDVTDAAAPGIVVDTMVLRHRVRTNPADTEAAATEYDVVIAGGQAVIRHPPIGPADLIFTSDYPTAAAIAAGQLSTRAALAEGRLRVAGDVGILSRRASDVAGLDPVPAGLRAETEF